MRNLKKLKGTKMFRTTKNMTQQKLLLCVKKINQSVIWIGFISYKPDGKTWQESPNSASVYMRP